MTKKEAIKTLREWRGRMADHGVPDFGEKYRALGMAIEALSAERTGEWIGREHCQVDEDAYDVAICSNCKAEITLEYPCDNFCPNCGCKMGGDTE